MAVFFFWNWRWRDCWSCNIDFFALGPIQEVQINELLLRLSPVEDGFQIFKGLSLLELLQSTLIPGHLIRDGTAAVWKINTWRLSVSGQHLTTCAYEDVWSGTWLVHEHQTIVDPKYGQGLMTNLNVLPTIVPFCNHFMVKDIATDDDILGRSPQV